MRRAASPPSLIRWAENRISYQYDASGNLVAVTDRTGNTTQFVYLSTPAHYLDKVIDPLGRTGVRTDYDAQGRLTRTIDAAGNSIQFTYDPTHSLQTVTDQNGNATTYEYDSRGNIVRQVDPLGAVTLRTYDADSNMLTETDPLGRTTTYTYDDRGDALTKVDPLGQTTISTYEAFTFGTTVIAASYGAAEAPFTRLTTTNRCPRQYQFQQLRLLRQPGIPDRPAGQYDQDFERRGGQSRNIDYGPARQHHD